MKPLMLGTLSRVPAARLLQLGECRSPDAADGQSQTVVPDGELVTPWSGPINQNMAGYVLGGATEAVDAGKQAVGIGSERSAGTESRTAQQPPSSI